METGNSHAAAAHARMVAVQESVKRTSLSFQRRHIMNQTIFWYLLFNDANKKPPHFIKLNGHI